MPRPLNRGSGGLLFPGNSNLLEDSQMKDKVEKEVVDRTRSSADKNTVYDNGFGSDPFNPGSLRSRFKFILLLLKLSLVAIVILAITGSFWWTLSITNSSRGHIHHGYRRLQEKLVLDLEEIGKLFSGPAKIKELDYCSPKHENFIPCFNVTENLAVGFSKGEELDRHCIHGVRQNCLVRAPVNYKVPLRWPTGKDLIWLGNVQITAQEVLSSGSLTKRMMVEEEQISFRPGNFMYDGVEDYSHQIAEMIGLRNESNFIQAGVRTVLDIGCGYGSFGAHLFSSNLLTMCIADYEASGSQVQLTTERGLPAMIGSFNSMQLPYPSLSFDMVHCRNTMDWDKKDGKLLIEVDRLLRPGGYFVWNSPVTQPSIRDKVNQKKWSFVQSFTQSLCWELLTQQEETAVWKKTSKKDCYLTRKSSSALPLCSKGQDVESPYYRPLQACIGGTQSQRWIPITKRTPWPSRANLNAKELAIHGLHAEDLSEDTKNWKSAIRNYWSLLSPVIFSDHPKRPGDEDPSPPYNMLRNVLDMNAHFGGFNAALLKAGKSVWVMNVIPVNTPSHLPLILDRGFTGVLHDCCYPENDRPGDEDPSPPYNMLRNVLDMNAHFGGFNAALLKAGKSVWVMNVIPVNTPNHLPLILDRGFTGVLHDWCEPFPTYPRTYDLVHGQGLLSLQFAEQRRCELIDLFTEIDRLLRPEGWIILHDSAALIDSARALAARLKWDARIVDLENASNEKLLICQKPFIRRQSS